MGDGTSCVPAAHRRTVVKLTLSSTGELAKRPAYSFQALAEPVSAHVAYVPLVCASHAVKTVSVQAINSADFRLVIVVAAKLSGSRRSICARAVPT